MLLRICESIMLSAYEPRSTLVRSVGTSGHHKMWSVVTLNSLEHHYQTRKKDSKKGIFLIVLGHLKMDVLGDGPTVVAQDVVNQRVVWLLAAKCTTACPASS